MSSSADRYRESGVDLDAAGRAKKRIVDAIASTSSGLELGHIGAFGGMFRLPGDVANPAVVASTDGVGTKVLVAIRAGVHDTIGLDLVNHCVDDILVHGARPIAFQDYFAAHTLDTEVVASVVEGVARGCRDHGMLLSGGETAQLPDLYEEGHYDLAGTIVGVVDSEKALHGDSIQPGDVLIGFASNGLHTNGYTLARNIVFDALKLEVDSLFPGETRTVAEVLLDVHCSYYGALAPVLDRVKGMAHITGGGIPGNLVRTLPRGCGARIDVSSWQVPNVFSVLSEGGAVEHDEMFNVFNMGVGMIVACAPDDADGVIDSGANSDVPVFALGEVVSGDGVVLE